MSLLAKLRTRYGEVVGVELFFAFPELFSDQTTYLDADSATGAVSLSADGVNFAVNQFVIIGQPGNIRSEIIQLHASTAPTSTAITLATATSFAHNRGDMVRFIPYNQIVPERSTDSGSTYSALSAVSIRADASETYLQRPSDASTDYYRFRFYNSSAAVYSAYSDVTAASGYADNSIFAVKERALMQIGEKRSELVSDKFLNDCLQEARRIADQNPAVFRWSFRTKFGQTLGQLLAGQYSISVPTDLRDQNTNKNLLSIRIGDQNRPVVYQDMNRFNQNYLNVVHSTTSGSTTSGATSMVLASTHNLPTTGTVTVANNTASGAPIAVAYTGNNKTTNTLTGCTGISRTITSGTDVWLRATYGLPSAYTISAGKIYLDVPLGQTYDGMDAQIDYYSQIPAISTDSQTFDEPFYDLYVPFLKWKIKALKANGKIDKNSDPDYQDWVQGVGQLIAQETPGQRINFIPDVDGFLSSSG